MANLDRVSTLEKIIRVGWEIQTWCDKCRAFHRFTEGEIVALAERVGYDFSLVNRRCRCRLTPGCDGWNRFDYLAGVYRPMTEPDEWIRQRMRDRALCLTGSTMPKANN